LRICILASKFRQEMAKFIASTLDKISKKNLFSFRKLNSLSKNSKIFQMAQKMREEM